MVAMLEGRLDTAASPETEKAMQPLYDCENQDIVIDCAKLEYISSSGLRIFLSVLKNTKPKGCHVYISGLNLYCFNDVNFWDPEMGVTGAGAGVYPLTKSFVGGIEVSF